MRLRPTFQGGILTLAAALAFMLIFPSVHTRGQPETGMEVLNFKAQLENHPPPNESQVRTLLEGARAQAQPAGIVLLTEAKLKMFNTNGTLGMVASTPRCIFDSEQRTINSTSLLHIQTADGKFTLEGEGFSLEKSEGTSLQKTNAHLVVSNRVHTVILN